MFKRVGTLLNERQYITLPDLCVKDYVILDEGHKIKNPANKCAKGVHMIRARNRIVLSGTPLMNNLKVMFACLLSISL